MRLSKEVVESFVKEALREDGVWQDITTLSFIPKDAKAHARIVSKEKGVVCGLPLAFETFKTFDSSLFFKTCKKEGDRVKKNETLATVYGHARSILTCERVALNFLSHLCGIATGTFEAAEKTRRYGIKILDTRKTTPLLRVLEKYAVRMGQGRNHRFKLSDWYLLKDNHRFILEKTEKMDVLARRAAKTCFEVEVDSLSELGEVLLYKPDIVMLDNFTPRKIRQAITLIQKTLSPKAKKPLIELSGGITLKNISRFCIKGVAFISLGSLTHSFKALDLSLEMTDCL